MTFEEIMPIWVALFAVLLYVMYAYWALGSRLLELEKKKNATIKK